jgi:hypothetical protein
VFDLESNRLSLREERVDLFNMLQELINEKNRTDQVLKKKLKLSLNLLTEAKNCFVKADTQKLKKDIYSSEKLYST